MEKLIQVFLRTLGGALLLVGLVGAYYGPLEIFVFYLFSEGGKFYYDGFGVGSLWFAYLVVQNLGYYIIAAICIPLGLGHLWLRRWALTLTRLTLWFWLGAGLILAVNILFLLPSLSRLDLSQEALVTNLAFWGAAVLAGGLVAPAFGLWFYYRETVHRIFAGHDPHIYWTERYPFPLLAALLLFLIIILVLHLAIFFQGLFPLFGQVLLGRPSAYIIALCILIAGILIYGLVQLRTWAWWGALGYTAALAISSLLTFSRYSFTDILTMLNLPAFELAFLDRLTPLRDFHLVVLTSVPLLVLLGLLVYSKRYFGRDDELRPSR